jgi:hypothetical protein
MAALPEADAVDLRAQLYDVALRAEAALQQLKTAMAEDAELFNAFEAKLQALLSMLGGPQTALSDLAQVTGIAIDPEQQAIPESLNAAVSFPPGSYGAMHTFYPLIGQHAELECES